MSNKKQKRNSNKSKKTNSKKTQKNEKIYVDKFYREKTYVDFLTLKVKNFCNYLKLGLSVTSSLALSELTREEYYRKIRNGEYPNLKMMVEKALAEAEYFALKNLQDLIKKKHIKAIMFFLERRFPNRWAKKTNFNFSINEINEESFIEKNFLEDFINFIKEKDNQSKKDDSEHSEFDEKQNS